MRHAQLHGFNEVFLRFWVIGGDAVMIVVKHSQIVIKSGQFDDRQVLGILFGQQIIFQSFLIIQLGIFVKIAIVPKPQSQCSVPVLRRMGFQHG